MRRAFVERRIEGSRRGVVRRARARRDDRPGSALGLWRGSARSPTSSSGPLVAPTRRGLEELRFRTHELSASMRSSQLGRHERDRRRAPVARRKNIRTANASSRSSCSRSIGRGGMPRRSRPTSCTRRRLDDDLGLQPSEDLQQLSARIVRQEPELRAPASARRRARSPPSRARQRACACRFSWLVAAAAAGGHGPCGCGRCRPMSLGGRERHTPRARPPARLARCRHSTTSRSQRWLVERSLRRLRAGGPRGRADRARRRPHSASDVAQTTRQARRRDASISFSSR